MNFSALSDLSSFLRPDDGAGGQAPAVRGPGPRQRAVGAGEQDRRDQAGGHRDLTSALPGVIIAFFFPLLLKLTLIRELTSLRTD